MTDNLTDDPNDNYEEYEDQEAPLESPELPEDSGYEAVLTSQAIADNADLDSVDLDNASIAPTLNPNDTDVAADLSRPSRAMQFRIQRRSQVSTAIPALIMIGVGLLLLVKPIELTLPITLAILLGALGAGLVIRFLLNARRERGLFFIGALVLLAIGVVAAAIYSELDLGQIWPLSISVIGLAMIVTFLFERSHDRGLLLPGLMLIVAGAVAVPFTMGIFPSSILSGVALYWPVLLLLVALAALPSAVRDRAD
jgi:hypothetical protein